MKKVQGIIGVFLGLFSLYTAAFGVFADTIQRGIHLLAVMVIIFLMGFNKKTEKGQKYKRLIDILFTIMIIVVLGNTIVNFEKMAINYGALSTSELIMGIIMILLLLEATRRTIGLPIVIIASFFIIYMLFGQYFPGGLQHRGYNLARVVSHLYLGAQGIFGIPLGTSATLVISFIIFGAFLEKSGGSQFFMDLSIALTGKSRGGPAKAAVVSSGLMGTISGTAAANVVTTGTFTIPLMKKTGYKDYVAGAIEAVASTGGQIMPPVMGAAAFIMAELLGIPYKTIALGAVIPALLYYVTVFAMVHLEAVRTGVERLKDIEIPDKKKVLIQGWHTFIPITILIVMLFRQFSPMYAGFYSALSIVIISLFRPGYRMTPKAIIESLVDASKNVLPVAIACGTAGIITGAISLTGLGLKLSAVIIDLSGGNLLIALILTLVTVIILGMGLPTAASYILVASLVTPALINMGVPELSAHMFVFYGAILSSITPPVAIAAYAAAGISKANPIKIAITACKYGVVAFLIPFFFVYEPALLWQGPGIQILLSALTGVVGCISLAAAVQGYLFTKLTWYSRVILLIGSLLMIYPGAISDIVGLALILTGIFKQFIIFFKKSNIAPKES